MQFIKATENFNTFENTVPAPYIRKSFVCEEKTTGKIKIASCGFYELYINGNRITKGFLAPYISNPDDYVYYDEYDISLDEGENVIGIMLGNGFQNNPGGYIWSFDKAAFRSAPMVAVELKYKNKNGECVTVSTDSTFKTHESAIRSDDYRFGEHYDANYEISGWNSKGFDDSSWNDALLAETPKGELTTSSAESLRTETELKPVNIFKEDDGYVYDFGISHSGVCRLCINGTKGQKVSLQHADLLKDGKFYMNNIWFGQEHWEKNKHIVHTDTYVCSGEGTETYQPFFTYHAFRYVKVTGITAEQATPDLLTYVVFHSDLKSRGGFSCSDEMTNKLQEITRRSDLSNFHYFPTDCPHREKNGWTADAALSSEHVLLNFNPENSYYEWMKNIRKTQLADGSLPGIIPTAGWGYEWGNGPAWDSVLVYLPYFTYIYRGETKMIEESVDAFIAYLKYLTTRVDDKGLMHIGLGDWCHVSNRPTKAPLAVTDTIMSMDISNKVAFLLDAIGKTEESAFAKSLAAQFRNTIRKELIDFDTMTVRGDCQTSQAMSLFYGVFEPEEEAAAFENLLKFIHLEDDHIDLGVLGARVIFHVLSKFGYSDLAFKMITRPDYPSYGNWIVRGATTLWEDFNPNSVSSTNHHFWGDISSWFIQNLAGIQYNPSGRDLKTVNIKPSFVAALQHAEGYYESPCGKIASAWKREGNNVSVSIEIPQEVIATVILPNGYTFEDGSNKKELKTGTYSVRSNA